ncbi:hypothetical protein FACS1894113_3600 [Alphaproteobacteria bacterium]|nr:hypothetical protein FACS1894113_3600 [Alphaproteobacteria bacterium]
MRNAFHDPVLNDYPYNWGNKWKIYNSFCWFPNKAASKQLIESFPNIKDKLIKINTDKEQVLNIVYHTLVLYHDLPGNKDESITWFESNFLGYKQAYNEVQ